MWMIVFPTEEGAAGLLGELRQDVLDVAMAEGLALVKGERGNLKERNCPSLSRVR